MNNLSSEDVAAIKAIGTALNRAALSSDWDAAAALFMEDVTFMPPNMAELQGRSTWREWIDSLKLTMQQHSVRFTEIDGCGDYAVARAAFTESFTIGSTGDSITDSGKALIIFQRQADGSWLISAECWNSNLPVSQALPEPQPEIG